MHINYYNDNDDDHEYWISQMEAAQDPQTVSLSPSSVPTNTYFTPSWPCQGHGEQPKGKGLWFYLLLEGADGKIIKPMNS